MLLIDGQAILLEFTRAQSLWLGLLFILSQPFIRPPKGSGPRQRSWSLNLAMLAHLVLVPVTAILRLQGIEMARFTEFGYSLFTLFLMVTILTRFLYFYLLPRLGMRPPQIAHDLFLITVIVFGFFMLAAQAGLNIMGVIATSAVVTAVIGLSLQDTLGNVIGGMMLQIDKTLSVGDWVKLGDISGRVSEISWRFTAIETRNWETVIVPNSQLMKGQVIILGKRSHPTLLWRRWVWFHVDFRYSPTEVIQIVTQGLKNADIPLVATEPAVNCLLMDFDASTARYAVRYWLTDPAVDDPTDSAVRVHLSYALKRAGIPLSVPTQSLFLNRGDPSHRGQNPTRDLEKRVQILNQIPLLSNLTPEEREQLAEKLLGAPFLLGETITSQGAEGHWLYILAQGKVSIRLREPGGQDVEVNQLEAVNFFGEMSLMTGAPRGSTVVALTDVLCYRLDKESFQEILFRRPEIAETIAEVLAERKAQTDLVSYLIDDRAKNVQEHKFSILANIRTFFGLDD